MMTITAALGFLWNVKRQQRRSAVSMYGPQGIESLEIRLLPAAATLGNVFAVPSRTIGEQVYDSIATDPQGNITVVFSDYGLDSSGWGIYARRFAADGSPLGNQFRLNSRVADDQFFPSIATNRDGKSLVVWRNERYGGGVLVSPQLGFSVFEF